ncbi:MAG: OmpH family outer membrane protein [Luteolibacter sp.]
MNVIKYLKSAESGPRRLTHSRLRASAACLAALLPLCGATPLSAGELRIAKVDLTNLYDHWPRLKGLQENAEKEVLPLRKELEELAKTREEKLKKLELMRREADRNGLPEDIRKSATKDMQMVFEDFQNINKKGTELNATISAKMKAALMEARKGMIKEVHAYCRVVAKRENYNMLINVGLESEGILMAEAEAATDITTEVQDELEKRAKAEPLTTPAAAAEGR